MYDGYDGNDVREIGLGEASRKYGGRRGAEVERATIERDVFCRLQWRSFCLDGHVSIRCMPISFSHE